MDLTEQNISEVTPHIIGLLDEWKLTPEQIFRLLGLEGQLGSRDLRKLRTKSASLPYSTELAERIEHIVGIVGALQTAYPRNAEMRTLWLYQPLRRFDKATPMAVMLKDNLDGLIKVRIEVDCAYGWSLNDQQPDK